MPLDSASVRLIEQRIARARGIPQSQPAVQPPASAHPRDLRAQARHTDNFIASIQQRFGRRVPGQWPAFYGEWQRFYANNFSSIASTGSHTQAVEQQLHRFAQYAGGWAHPRPQQMGASLVYSPGQIQAEADTVNNIITQLATDVAASPKIKAQSRAAFGAFTAEWQTFYSQHLGLVDRLWFSTMEKISEYRHRAADWKKQLKKQGLKTSTPDDNPTKPGISFGIPWWAWLAGAGGLVGLYFIVRIVRGSVLAGAALEEAEADAIAVATAVQKRKAARKVVTIS